MYKAARYYINSFNGLPSAVWQLSLVALINRSGMMVVPFMTLYMTQELGWTKFHTGIATSFFGIGALLGSLLGGWLSDRVGTYKIMVASLITSGLAFIVMYAIKDFYFLCFWLMLTSCLAEAYRPAGYTAMSKYTNDENLTRSISLMRMAVNLGISVGPAVGGFLAGTYGYEWIFILDGITCICAGLYLAWALRGHSDEEKESAQQKTAEEPIRSAYRDWPFILFVGFNMINLIAFFQILYAAPVYFREVFEMSEQQIGWYFTANGLLIFLVEMPLIFKLEKKNRAFPPLIKGASLIAISYLMLFLFDTPFVAVMLFTLFVSLGEILNFPFFRTVGLKRANSKNKGEYMGLSSMGVSLAFILAPLAGLPVIEVIGYDLYWLAAMCMSLFAIIGYVLTKRELEFKD